MAGEVEVNAYGAYVPGDYALRGYVDCVKKALDFFANDFGQAGIKVRKQRV